MIDSELVKALNALTEQIRVYNQRHEPVASSKPPEEADFGKAIYGESEEARERHEYLKSLEASRDKRRALAGPKRSGA
jgi:hypothetical protein